MLLFCRFRQAKVQNAGIGELCPRKSKEKYKCRSKRLKERREAKKKKKRVMVEKKSIMRTPGSLWKNASGCKHALKQTDGSPLHAFSFKYSADAPSFFPIVALIAKHAISAISKAADTMARANPTDCSVQTRAISNAPRTLSPL